MGLKRYVKAREALPQELVEEISRHLGGREAYLWIPAARNLQREDRDRYVLKLNQQGLSSREIGERLLIDARQVRRIVQRAKSLPSLDDQKVEME